MSDKYPLYPELSEEGNKEAQALIDKFKESLIKVADEAIGDFYCDVAVHIESDSWTNYRNEMMDGFRNYDNRKIQGKHDFKIIRQEILKNHREDIIKDLNQDLLKEIETLKKHIEFQNRLIENRH